MIFILGWFNTDNAVHISKPSSVHSPPAATVQVCHPYDDDLDDDDDDDDYDDGDLDDDRDD